MKLENTTSRYKAGGIKKALLLTLLILITVGVVGLFVWDPPAPSRAVERDIAFKSLIE